MPMNPRLMRPLARRQAPSDPYFSSVVLLLHMDGANGSTTFTDSSSFAHAATPFNAAQISTAQSKFGGASGAFSVAAGNDDALIIPHNAAFSLGASDLFTIECWYYPTSFGSYNYLVAKGGDFDGTGREWGFGVVEGNVFLYRSLFGDVLYFAPASIALNEWCHLAWSHDGTTLRVFKDGVEVGDTTWGTQYAFGGTGNLWVGKFLDYTEIAHDARGHIDDLRITKGVARYTAAFTPPTAPFPNQ